MRSSMGTHVSFILSGYTKLPMFEGFFNPTIFPWKKLGSNGSVVFVFWTFFFQPKKDEWNPMLCALLPVYLYIIHNHMCIICVYIIVPSGEPTYRTPPLEKENHRLKKVPTGTGDVSSKQGMVISLIFIKGIKIPIIQGAINRWFWGVGVLNSLVYTMALQTLLR